MNRTAGNLAAFRWASFASNVQLRADVEQSHRVAQRVAFKKRASDMVFFLARACSSIVAILSTS